MRFILSSNPPTLQSCSNPPVIKQRSTLPSQKPWMPTRSPANFLAVPDCPTIVFATVHAICLRVTAFDYRCLVLFCTDWFVTASRTLVPRSWSLMKLAQLDKGSKPSGAQLGVAMAGTFDVLMCFPIPLLCITLAYWIQLGGCWYGSLIRYLY